MSLAKFSLYVQSFHRTSLAHRVWQKAVDRHGYTVAPSGFDTDRGGHPAGSQGARIVVPSCMGIVAGSRIHFRNAPAGKTPWTWYNTDPFRNHPVMGGKADCRAAFSHSGNTLFGTGNRTGQKRSGNQPDDAVVCSHGFAISTLMEHIEPAGASHQAALPEQYGSTRRPGSGRL